MPKGERRNCRYCGKSVSFIEWIMEHGKSKCAAEPSREPDPAVRPQLRQRFNGKPVPEDAPARCKRGYHRGQERGGTMGFTCTDCGGFYEHEYDFSGLTVVGDMMANAGMGEEAVEMTRQRIRETYEGSV
jgi:hypothetical protein